MMPNHKVTAAALDELRADIDAIMAAHDKARGFGPRHVIVRVSRRYASLMVVDDATGRERYHYGFVDLTNGNILMARGRFGPDPIPRGNLFDSSDPSGKPGRSALGQYGVKYLPDMMADPATAAMVTRLRARFGAGPGTSSPVPAPGVLPARKVARRYLRIARWTPTGETAPGPWHLFEAYEVNSGHYETLCGQRPSAAETRSLSAVAPAPATSRPDECPGCRRTNREPGS